MQTDDAIAALMDQLRQQQGYYEAPDQTNTMMPSTKSTSDKQRYSPLVPELDGYPNELYVAGNHSIWNPFVAPAAELSKYETTGSIYIQRHLPTNPQVEVIRRRAFEKFKQECTELLQRIQEPWQIKLPIPAMLEKWHMDAKLTEFKEYKENKKGHGRGQQQVEPVVSTEIPTLATTEEIYFAIVSSAKDPTFMDPILLEKKSSELFSSTLMPEVKKAWSVKQSSDSSSKSPSLPPKFAKKCEQIQKALYRCICLALELFQQQLAQATNLEKQQTQIQRGKRGRKIPKITSDDETNQYRVTFAGISFKVHAAYFEKLQRLYDRVHKDKHIDSLYKYCFEEVLFCLLCRYDMLQGAGLQAGVPGRVMDTLLQQFDCRMECFASPLNCRYERFASVFDVDRAFGSRGSFFDLPNTFFAAGGCYQANPPFCEGVIDEMNSRIRELLEITNTSKPLMFVVFVPAWKESKAYQEGLLENLFLTKHMLLLNGTHWYAEGTQHRRKGSFRPASFDTSVLFYQNESAKQQWPINDQVLDELKRAFCSDPGTMDKVLPVGARKDLKTPIKTNIEEARTKAKQHVQGKGPSDGLKEPHRRVHVKADKKRRWSNQNDESNAQLELLESLGLSNCEEKTKAVLGSGTIQKRKHKKKKK